MLHINNSIGAEQNYCEKLLDSVGKIQNLVSEDLCSSPRSAYYLHDICQIKVQRDLYPKALLGEVNMLVYLIV